MIDRDIEEPLNLRGVQVETQNPVRPRPFQRIFAGAEEFDDRERDIRKALRIDTAAPFEEGIERGRIRFERQSLTKLSCQMHDSVPALGPAQYAPESREVFPL